MNTGIYQIVCKTTGKRYIGSTSKLGFEARWGKHKIALRNGQGTNPKFQAAWNKYGENDFVFLVLDYLPPDQCLQAEQMYFDTVPHHTLLNVSFNALGGNNGANKGMKYPSNPWAGATSVKSSNHVNNRQVECPHCFKSGQQRNMIRWHFDNCKDKTNGTH
jgi:group I intron endonuclease